MPTYDYHCNRCGAFEGRQSIALRDTPLDCPVCGNAANRVLGDAPRLASGLSAGARSRIGAEEQAMGGGYSRLRHPMSCSCCH